MVNILVSPSLNIPTIIWKHASYYTPEDPNATKTFSHGYYFCGMVFHDLLLICKIYLDTLHQF